MLAYGVPPFLECSSVGDRRFSAMYAVIHARGGQTIEKIYQASKIFADGSTGLDIKLAKGRKPVNLVASVLLYSQLWDDYLGENPDLAQVLLKFSGLSDRFGQVGHVCQATELWRIRTRLLFARNHKTLF